MNLHKPRKKYIKPDPDYMYVYNELQKHRKINLRFLWEEYKSITSVGLEYSRFCERYNRWKGTSGKNVSMHQEREAGKELFVDWMGDKLPLVADEHLQKHNSRLNPTLCVGDPKRKYRCT